MYATTYLLDNISFSVPFVLHKTINQKNVNINNVSNLTSDVRDAQTFNRQYSKYILISKKPNKIIRSMYVFCLILGEFEEYF